MHVTASIGYYHCGYGFDYNKATMMADRNLYVAKERRNCVISELQIE
jgi:GGDEF domain-containing protein